MKNIKDHQSGYVYHIKDEYFAKANDPNLMQNKEGDYKRPTYYCLKDHKTGLLWVIPMSSRLDKYKTIHDKHIAKYGRCLILAFGTGIWERSVFLLQNMFPITEYYIDHIHVIGGVARAVEYPLQEEIKRKFDRIRQLRKQGLKPVFTDIDRLEKLMLSELENNPS